MRKALLVAVVVLALVAARFWPTGVRPEPPPPGAVAVLRLDGSPRQKGVRHGTEFRGSIRARLARERPADPGLAAFAIDTCGARILPVLPGRLREEIAGIAEGAGVTVHEALFLSTRFELRALGLLGDPAPPGEIEAAVGPGPEAVRVVAPGEAAAADLVVFVHEDTDPPLVLVAHPGMAGGFLGLRGDVAAAARPAGDAHALTGLPWTLLLRVLLETPPAPGDALPAAAASNASFAMVLPGAGPGALNVTLAGAAWYPSTGAYAAATDEWPEAGGDRIAMGRRDAATDSRRLDEARRLLQGATPAAGVAVRLRRAGSGARVSIGGRRATVRRDE